MNKLTRLSFYIGISIACLSFISCGTGNSTDAIGESTTENGYRMIRHTFNEGLRPSKGMHAYFEIYMRSAKKVITSSKTQNRLGRYSFTGRDRYKGNVPAWVDALWQMSEKDSVTVYMPIDSMRQRPPGTEGEEFIMYDLVMVELLTVEEFKEREAEEKAKAEEERKVFAERSKEVLASTQSFVAKVNKGSIKPDQTLQDGLGIYIHEKGTGPLPTAGANVDVHYYGVLKSDATPFDNSFERGNPISFPLGQGRVIKGWDIGIAALNEGTKATLVIPWQLAYGQAGSPPKIGPKADLVFYVELAKVSK